MTYLLALAAGLGVATVLGGAALTAAGFAALSSRSRRSRRGAWRDGWDELMAPPNRRHRVGLGVTAVAAVLFFAVLFAHTLSDDAAGNLNAGFQTVWADWSQHLTTTNSFAVAHNLPPQNPLFSGQDLRYPFLPDFQSATLVTLGTSPAVALALPGALLAVCVVLLVVALAVRLGAGLAVGVARRGDLHDRRRPRLHRASSRTPACTTVSAPRSAAGRGWRRIPVTSRRSWPGPSTISPASSRPSLAPTTAC